MKKFKAIIAVALFVATLLFTALNKQDNQEKAPIKAAQKIVITR